MSKFSAPINPERPRGAPTCQKCAHCFTYQLVNEHGARLVCEFGRDLNPCADFRDSSVERTVRRGLKPGYDVARVA